MKQIGGGKCSLCGSENTSMVNCPLNAKAKHPNPLKHPRAVIVSSPATPPPPPLPPRPVPTTIYMVSSPASPPPLPPRRAAKRSRPPTLPPRPPHRAVKRSRPPTLPPRPPLRNVSLSLLSDPATITVTPPSRIVAPVAPVPVPRPPPVAPPRPPLKLGQGGFGCAYRPSFPCLEGPPPGGYESTISKIMNSADARKEAAEYNSTGLRDLDPTESFHISNGHLCTPPPNTALDCGPVADGPRSQLIMKDGVSDISKYLRNGDAGTTPSLRAKIIFGKLENVLRGLTIMTENNLFHFDIKDLNIVVGKPTEDCRLIDFGFMYKHDPTRPHRVVSPGPGLNRFYYVWPLDSLIYVGRTGAIDRSRIQRDVLYWNTNNKIQKSHSSYNYYVKKYKMGPKDLLRIEEELTDLTRRHSLLEIYNESIKKVDVYSIALTILNISRYATPRVKALAEGLLDRTNALHYNPFVRCSMRELYQAYRDFVLFL